MISPSNMLKFNLKKDTYKNKIGFELGKVHDQTLFSVACDNVLSFGILCTKKKNNNNKTPAEKRRSSKLC